MSSDHGAILTQATTTDYWQSLHDTLPDRLSWQPPFRLAYPVRLPDGRALVLPLRPLPDGQRAVASLIANQASFTVVNALADHVTNLARTLDAEIIVGMPTLGLAFAPLVAERLGHTRFVPLGYSRKYWYDDALSEPVLSITSPGGGKRVYLDPNMLPLLRDRRICIVDDAVSTGSSLLAGYRLLSHIGFKITGAAVPMKQSTRWQEPVASADPDLPPMLKAVFGSPLFQRTNDGWAPIDGTLPSVP